MLLQSPLLLPVLGLLLQLVPLSVANAATPYAS
jgi:hypothetical protein